MAELVRRRRKPEINIIPLMDVLTILIFFFLVSMQFRDMTTLNLTLPRIETAGVNEFVNSLTIGIDRENQITVILEMTLADGTSQRRVVPVSRTEFEDLVDTLQPVARDLTALIRAHETTPLNEVTYVMDVLRKRGLNRIRLQSR